MDVRQDACDPAVDLLREGRVLVEGAQACLDVPQAHLAIEARHAGRHHRGRVALDQHPVRVLRGEHRLEPRDHSERDVGQRLLGKHHPQVVVGLDLEQAEHRIE